MNVHELFDMAGEILKIGENHNLPTIITDAAQDTYDRLVRLAWLWAEHVEGTVTA